MAAFLALLAKLIPLAPEIISIISQIIAIITGGVKAGISPSKYLSAIQDAHTSLLAEQNISKA